MPVTFWTFLIGGLALSGFPLMTAGFWSKDEILAGAFNGGHLVVFVTLALAALLTAFYTMRQITLTFLGEPRTKAAEHAQENKPVMTVPLVVLAVFAVTAGWVGIPETFPLLGGLIPNWFEEFVGSMLPAEAQHAGREPHPTADLAGGFAGRAVPGLAGLPRASKPAQPDPLSSRWASSTTCFKNKYYIDELYHDRVHPPGDLDFRGLHLPDRSTS